MFSPLNPFDPFDPFDPFTIIGSAEQQDVEQDPVDSVVGDGCALALVAIIVSCSVLGLLIISVALFARFL